MHKRNLFYKVRHNTIVKIHGIFLHKPRRQIKFFHNSISGRSRNLIIRELQRTNLDVNLAVNNLLSRDEEDGDDADDSQDNYVPEVRP